MPDSTKETRAVLRQLLDQMTKALATAKPQPGTHGGEFIPPPGYRTRVNVREFLRGQKDEGDEGSWWDSGSDGDPLIGLRPPRRRRGPRR